MGDSVACGLFFEGANDYLVSGTDPVKQAFKLPEHLGKIGIRLGLVPSALRPATDSMVHITGKAGQAIEVVQGYEKALALVEGIREAAACGNCRDVVRHITNIGATVADLAESGFELAAFFLEGTALEIVEKISYTVLSGGMALLTLNQALKISKASQMIRVLEEFKTKREVDSKGSDLLKGKEQLLEELSNEEIDQVIQAVSARKVNHWLLVARWVSFLVLGIFGVLTAVFALPLSPWFLLIASATAVVLAIVSGLHEHIKVAGAFRKLRREQVELVEDFAPAKIKAQLSADRTWKQRLAHA